MNKNIWFIVAAALVFTGCILFGCVMAVLKWDFAKLSTNEYETNSYEINEKFLSVSVDTDTANIRFAPSEDTKCKVVCYEQKKLRHSVSINDGELSIKVEDTRKWYEHIGITFGTPTITVYLPETEYSSLAIEGSTGNVEIPKDFRFDTIDISVTTGDVTNHASAVEGIKIETSTGSILVESISAGRLALSVSTGRVTVSDVTVTNDITVNVSTGKTALTNITCDDLFSYGNTGDVNMIDLVANGKLSVERSTGYVRFDGCDAAEICVETDTGDVVGSLLSDKVFVTKSDTGDIDVPNSISGGRCEITTDTGDIKITVG